MGNYLPMATQHEVSALLRLGWSQRRIARELGVHRETVARYAHLGGAAPPTITVEGAAEAGPPGQTRPNPIAGSAPPGQTRPNPIKGPASLAAPYHELIVAALEQGLTAQRIWQDLAEAHGFPGGYLSVQRYCRRLKRGRPEVADRMEHPPGAEGQIDFFKSPALVLDPKGRWRRPWVFRMTLSCSRHGYEEGLWSQAQAGFLRAQEHAFAAFGGVPRVVRLDNTKAGVAQASLYDPDLSERYEAFASYYGFIALPSRPHHPEEQGVEERAGGYVKSNALKGRRFQSLEEMNAFLRRWNRQIAALRIHGSTRRQVLAHFLEVERPALQPVPPGSFPLFELGTRVVHPDGYIEVEGAYYTAPHHLVGQRVKVRWDERLVRISHEGTAVRVHAKQARPGAWVTDPADRPAHKPARQAAYQASLLARAERVGPNALAWAEAAVEERDVRAYRLLQGMLALTRRHPAGLVDGACATALRGRSFRYRTLRRLVEEAAARAPAPERRLTQEHPLIRSLWEYASAIASRGETP
jgi:transposase